MTGPNVARLAALGVGGLQLLANAALLVRGPLREGNTVAWRVAVVAAIYYMGVGVATFLLGAALFISLWSARASYPR